MRCHRREDRRSPTGHQNLLGVFSESQLPGLVEGRSLGACVLKCPQAVRSAAAEMSRQKKVVVVRASHDHSGVTMSLCRFCLWKGQVC